jgi:hypothetical protein
VSAGDWDATLGWDTLYIAAIDCKDAFGSVTHDILKQNLKKVGLLSCLVNKIIDSYNDAFVRIWNQGEASNPIQTEKESNKVVL